MIYRLKIELSDSRPKIWRTFEVNSNMVLPDFHKVCQTVMGWLNEHLYMFISGDIPYQPKDEFTESFAEDFGNVIPLYPKKEFEEMTLEEILNNDCKEIEYMYDFGDGWEHTISLEEQKEGELKYPVCISGKKNCPPEDCGGLWGYKDLLKILKKGPDHNEYDNIMEWLGGEFDSEYFSKKEINFLLTQKGYGSVSLLE